jgi:hypothetical protein
MHDNTVLPVQLPLNSNSTQSKHKHCVCQLLYNPFITVSVFTPNCTNLSPYIKLPIASTTYTLLPLDCYYCCCVQVVLAALLSKYRVTLQDEHALPREKFGLGIMPSAISIIVTPL